MGACVLETIEWDLIPLYVSMFVLNSTILMVIVWTYKMVYYTKTF